MTNLKRRPRGASYCYTRSAWRSMLAILPLIIILFAGGYATAQDAAQTRDVERLRNAITDDSSLGEETRAELLEQLVSISENREKAAAFRKTQSEIEDRLQNSDALIADFEDRERDVLAAPSSIERRLGSEPSLSSIETEANIVESQRAALAAERAEALDAMANLADEEAMMRERMAEISKARVEMVGETKDVDPSLPAEEQISILGSSTRKDLLAAESELLELRLRGAPALNNIRSARIGWLDAAITDADALLQQLTEAAGDKRESAAAQRAGESRRMIAQLSSARPELKALAEENLALVSDYEALSSQIEGAQESVANIRRLADEIGQDADLTERRLDVAGLESQLGEVMLSRLASLPDSQRILAENARRNEAIADVSISTIDTEQKLRELGDRASFLERVLEGDTDAADVRIVERLYVQRRQLLQENMQAGNTLLGLLVDSNQAATELARITRDYETLLTANLLWVRNYAYLNTQRVMEQIQRVANVRSLGRLQSDWSRLLVDPAFIITLLLFLAAAIKRRRLREVLEKRLGKPTRPSEESASQIFRALFLSVLVCLPLPLAFATVGRAMSVLAAGDTVVASVGVALIDAGVILFALGYMGHLAQRLGVGRRMLKWNSARADVAIRDLSWFRPAVATSVAATVVGLASSPTDSGGAIAAAGSLATSTFIFIVALRMLRSGQFSGERIALFCLRACTLIAGAIIFMHVSGQLFAAHLYLRALSLSIAAVIGALLVTNTLNRVLLLFRANLERKARIEEKARAEAAGEVTAADETPDVRSHDPVNSLSDAYARLLTMVRVVTIAGLLWLIWSPALPALSIFDAITLWTTTDVTLPVPEVRNITLSTFLFAIAVIGITSLITKHLPPLLNVVLMEWTKVSAGSRYAAGMLVQYVIMGVGFSTALVMLGFQWEKVQWLVAALGVGIGFGLQEIVANFISGLIVLFERPIRVGDIINAGGTDGVVTRINARATVIETFDGKEVMVPNKELITGIVTNWSLSSSKLRLVIPIGIAYGSDVDSAMEKLLKIAKADPDIIEEPEPFVTFEDFGDNALVLWLRCFALKDYPRVSTRLRQAIYREFNDAGISISFPQRDVHLDASEPLPVRILPPLTDS